MHFQKKSKTKQTQWSQSTNMNDSTKNCNRCTGAFIFTDIEIVCGKCGIVVR